MISRGLAFAALLLAAVPTAVPHLALKVINPEETGRRILHFEDVIGPGARAVGDLKPARALFVHAVSLEGCPHCPDALARLAALDKRARPLGGLVVAVVLTTPQEVVRVERAYRGERFGFVVAVDPYGLARERLGLGAPGTSVVIGADGKVLSHLKPDEGQDPFARAERAFLDPLGD